MTAALKTDPTLRGAVETAREAAVSIAESGAVGDHLGMEMVEERLATHYFTCTATRLPRVALGRLGGPGAPLEDGDRLRGQPRPR